jgi:exodeoxyribonuclease-3
MAVMRAMKIATWNVNSIRQREGHVKRWLERVQPDLLFLQEIKCETAAFPSLTFQAVGYQSDAVGQKAYNGVAVLSRIPFQVIHRTLPGLPEDDAQSRYIEVEAGGLTVIGIYLPNGNSRGEEGYAYKLAWMDRLAERAQTLLEEDLSPGALSPGDALVRPETRARFRRLLWLGLTDAIRALHPHGRVFTFWDYQSAAWERDSGLRIDHALLSPTVAERLVAADPDREERNQAQPSDHVPVVVEIE